jgi:hypothetical protein
MYDSIHEKIQVTARFQPGKRPDIKSFTWKDKEHVVEQVTLVSKARKGREVVWLFNVATKTAAFKLRFDTDSLTWWLEQHTWGN